MKAFLSVATHGSIAVVNVGLLYYWLQQFIGYVVEGWLRAGRGVKSASLNAAQRLFEWDRGAGGFFEWGRQLAVGLFSGALHCGMAENVWFS